MIGLGILEFGLLLLGGSYIYSLLSNKNKIQYIELDQNQFQRLQTTLVNQNILPNRMLIYTDSNTGIIPPTYDESNYNYVLNNSLSNNPAVLDVSIDSNQVADAPAYEEQNSISIAQDISNSSPLLIETEDNNTLPPSNLYPSTRI